MIHFVFAVAVVGLVYAAHKYGASAVAAKVEAELKAAETKAVTDVKAVIAAVRAKL